LKPRKRKRPDAGGGTLTKWYRVDGIYDAGDSETQDPFEPHEDFGRGLSIVLQTITVPTVAAPGELSWADAVDGEDETVPPVFAFPDPIILDALGQARADPDGLGAAITLRDYYETNQIYKVITVQGVLVVLREPFAILGGPEYEAPA
jgi:hypothetical protein